ncbi:hypothetical protein [Porphyromonas circumdentaria]|uniref:Uncharacterized protein n=1 Tax=Porphyromonas circumdentaria TaxID=29524 RepID=A0A1T4KRD0_9PORP|nr:hypothetical protein [Porphyromonas circumdentaria]MBB6274933.1 hypothetical protein [Porphyromonas circumdentaria]MDO4722234.1 hypothetical protein [Porphyromonas circumdentaria]SJZ44975.1 hypothetical protein SAMN02745171_00160 [Porphyromonas circumdentaria]
MASKRNLKKGIKEITTYLVDDILLLYNILGEDSFSEIESLLCRTVALSVETVTKVSHAIGTKNSTSVKEYYKNLQEKFNDEVEEIEESIEKLLEKNIN